MAHVFLRTEELDNIAQRLEDVQEAPAHCSLEGVPRHIYVKDVSQLLGDVFALRDMVTNLTEMMARAEGAVE